MANTLEKLKILSVASWWFAGFYVIFDVSPLMIRKEFQSKPSGGLKLVKSKIKYHSGRLAENGAARF